MYKQQLSTARAPERVKVPKDLLEAKARWNKERRDAAKNKIRRTVNAAGYSNRELRKQMIYSLERKFIEDKQQKNSSSPKKTIIRKNDLRKSG